MMQILLFIVCSFLTLHANKFDEIYHEAAHVYNDKEYQKAYDLYASLESKSSVVLYNQALCKYNLKEYLAAFIYLKKAALLADYNLQKTIIQVMQEVCAKLGLQPISLQEKVYMLLIASCSFLVVQVLFLLTWFLLLFVSHRVIRYVLSFMFIVLFCIMLLLYVAHFQRHGVVIQDAYLYVGPNKSYSSLKEVTVGQEVKVVQELDSWYKITDTQSTGWINQSDIALL